MIREPVEATPRKAFTKKQRAEAFLAGEGRCALCKKKIVGEYDIDHRIALHHGGAHDPSNWQITHSGCHREKTKDDVRVSAKIKRLIKANDPDRVKKESRLKGRGFEKPKVKPKWPKRPFRR